MAAASLVGTAQVAAADDDVSFCGIPAVDEVRVDQTTWAQYSGPASDYYDDKIARINAFTNLQHSLGMSREDFCVAAKWLIDQGGQDVVAGALGRVMIGDTGLLREHLFESALVDATQAVHDNNAAGTSLPVEIPAVGGGADATAAVVVADAYLAGTSGTATTSPTWDHQSGPGTSWYENGRQLAASCATSGPAYPVFLASGGSEQWTTYLRITDGNYVKSAAVGAGSDADRFGLPGC